MRHYLWLALHIACIIYCLHYILLLRANTRKHPQPEGKKPEGDLPALEAAVMEEEETVLPGTFDALDTDDIPLYPGLPEQAEVGDIPDDDGDILEAIDEEFAA